MIGFKKSLVASSIALAMLASTCAFAAYGLPETPAPVASNNWYLGALGGVSFVSSVTRSDVVFQGNVVPSLQIQHKGVGWDFGAELGYRGGPLRYEAQYLRLNNNYNFKIQGVQVGTGNLIVNAGMLNVLYDFGDRYASYIPYIGGGIGYANIQLANFSADNKFAYQAMLGVGFTIVDNAILDLGYRFFGTTQATHTYGNKSYISNMINIGFNYYVD